VAEKGVLSHAGTKRKKKINFYDLFLLTRLPAEEENGASTWFPWEGISFELAPVIGVMFSVTGFSKWPIPEVTLARTSV
jgi:hypothetical protein